VARTAAPATTNLLFVAGFGHAPNSDAAVWFAQHVLPLVSSKIPRVKLVLAGSNPTADVIRLANESVEVTGRLSEEKLAALYHQSRVAVVPLRFGAGVKLKVVEALYFGLPLVTTPIGTQGLQEIDSIVTATLDPEAMAASILQLLHDDALWLKKSQAQTAYAKEQFSRIAYNARVGAILDNL
jgi:glycosyltransferase involved in cell wall biosynthesis